MKTTLVLAHPWHGSFNKAILDTITRKLDERSEAYRIIDLNKDKFNPVMEEHDLALFSKGDTTDELVKKYQDILMDTKELIFIFPIWWFDMTAILKGFIDKVMLKNFSYIQTNTGLKGLLTHIEKTYVISTSDSPNWYLKLFAGNPIKRIFIKNTLKGNGLKNIKWINSDQTTSGTNKKRENFLRRIENLFNN